MIPRSARGGRVIGTGREALRAKFWEAVMVFKFLGLGKKAPKLKLDPKQEIELEIVSGDNVDNHFTRVIAVERKKIIVSTPSQNRIQVSLEVGEAVTVTYLESDLSVVSWFETTVLDRKEREIDLALPTQINEERTPIGDADFSIEIPIPVEYRAMSTAYLQTATTRSISATGINILTNLSIPQSTLLHIELQIPNAPTVKTQGRVAKSQKVPNEKKHLTEIEFEDITPADKDTIYRYALFYQQRQQRKSRREE
jgi:c-di-GMP-binding flagellar brake protein YcgR